MHVGKVICIQNLDDVRSDEEIVGHELALAEEAEDLGFDSLWAAEHHFAGYHMCPDVVQLLTWLAARTKRVRLGSAVVVLPWHEPVRVAEDLSMLDTMSGGRLLLGLGRGLGRIEFDGFGVAMAESRQRFVEYAEAIVNAFDTGIVTADGEYLKQPPVAIRPAPRNSLRGRVYASAVSPESMEVMARLGFGVMVIAQKPWDVTEAEVAAYRQRFVAINGFEPPKPLLVSFVAVDRSEQRAQELYEQYITRNSRSSLDHYQFDNADLANIPGYEYYGRLAHNIATHGPEKFVRFLSDLQFHGTPAQAVEQLTDNVRRLDAAGVLAVTSYGGMDVETSRANQDLFAREVLPALHAIDVHRAIPQVGAGNLHMSADTFLDGVRVIDADTHVIEPYDLWTSRVSTAKWGDLVPHVQWDERRQVDLWYSGDRILAAAGSACQAGWAEAPPRHPPRLSDVDPSLWRNVDRLRLMDEYGIYAQVLYPNVAGFGAGRFVDLGDMELAHLLLGAYNDFLIEYSSVDPNRFIPIMAVPFWDLDLSIAEMERCRANGHKGMLFSQAPDFFGVPMLSDPHWDRLWAAAQDLEFSVNFHIGGGDMSGFKLLHQSAGPSANFASTPVSFFVGNAKTVATVIGSGICHRFPRLKFVSVESGVGWLPFAMEALDWMWKECDVVGEHPEYDLLPSEYFRRQIYGCFWFEHGPSLDAALATLGPDNFLYETDFPHPTSMSPGPKSSALVPKQFIAERLGRLPSEVLQKLLHDNAARVYGLD